MSADLKRCECGERAIGCIWHEGGVKEPICGTCLERVAPGALAEIETVEVGRG